MTPIRRRLALAGATALALLPHAPRPARGQGAARRFRLGHNNSVESVLHTTATAMAEALRGASGGRLQIDVSPNSTLGTEAQMTEAVSKGTLDLNLSPAGSAAVLARDVALTEMPYLFRDAAHARSALDGALGRHCAGLLQPKGAVVLAWSEVGLRHITANKPVRSPAELRGLKIRVPISDAILESFRAMGAAADILPFPQLPDALRTGRFEAQENPVNIIVAGGLQRYQSHISLTGHVYTALPVLMSADVLEELSEGDRALFAAAAQKGAEAGRAHADRMERDGLAQLRAAGMTVVEDVDRAAFRGMVATISERLSAKFGAEPVAAFRRLAG